MALRQFLKRLNHPNFASSMRNFASSEKLIDVQLNEKTGITTITLQKLPVNSLNYTLLSQLLDVLRDLTGSKTRGVILTSASPTVFSAGLDILEMYKPSEERLNKFMSTLQDTWLALYGSDFPTVAAINGHAPAGGCMLAMCCEYRVMLPKFTIGLNESQVGLVAPTWLQSSMRNIIGARQAELALTTGRLFSTDEALKLGLIDEIASDKNDLIAKAESFLGKYARISPVARSMTKMSFRSTEIKALEKFYDQEKQIFISHVTKPEVQIGLGNYLQALKKNKTSK